MEHTPKISIIVPVYNMEKYLHQCVDSILAQTFKDFELLLIDDGSKDSSPKICDDYAAADSRVKVVHKENSGQADSRNMAIAMAKAPLIGFVDSDDWIEPDMYEVLYRTMMENDADISICSYFMSYVKNDAPVRSSGEVEVYDREEAMLLLLRDKKIKSFLWDKLFRREVITDDMPKSYRYEDYSTLIKWFASAGTVAFCKRPEYHYRQRAGSTDHEVSPIRMWHFFLAEVERCSFMRKTGIIHNIDNELVERVIRTGITQAKDMSRACDYETSIKYLGEIVKIMKDFGCTTDRCRGIRIWWRMSVLYRSPAVFIRLMRITGIFNLKFGKGSRLYV